MKLADRLELAPGKVLRAVFGARPGRSLPGKRPRTARDAVPADTGRTDWPPKAAAAPLANLASAAIVDNGVVRKLNVEAVPGKVETSSAEALLKQL